MATPASIVHRLGWNQRRLDAGVAGCGSDSLMPRCPLWLDQDQLFAETATYRNPPTYTTPWPKGLSARTGLDFVDVDHLG